MLVAKKSELITEFNEEGLSRVEILPGAAPHMQAYKCVLKAGCSWQPKLYAWKEKTQFFAFVTATGFVTTETQSYNITDYANFVPNYDEEVVTIYAGKKDLEFYQFIGEISQYDIDRMDYIHIELPRFRLFKDAWRYVEGFNTSIGSTCQSHMVMEHRYMGRYSMGWNVGDGPSVIGEHVHDDLDQWYFILPGGSMTYSADGQSIHVSEGDVTYSKPKTPHGSVIAENEKINYFWVECAIDGYSN